MAWAYNLRINSQKFISDIALSAIYLVESDTTVKYKAIVAAEIHKIWLNDGCCNLFVRFLGRVFIY